jgi:putative ABC transport system permease protein
MTLPFENDTSRIVKKYAKHSISQSRVKTFLSVLTIALAVALLSGFALSVIGMETEAKRELLVSSQMLYHNLNDEQMQTLRHDERISDSKIYMQAANTQIENYLVIPVYIEQNNSQIVMDEIVEGQYPIDLYDVAVDKAYLEQLGLPVELGVTITIPFYDGNTENFTVVGLTDSGSTERVYSLFCSKQYTEAGSQFQHSVTALAVQFAHADEMSKQVFEAMTKQIEADYGIPAQNSDPNDGFLSSLEPNWEDIQIVMIFSFAVLFVSYLVIYSIFYIYVHNQVREFGQLRTMGTTAKQIKKILRVQGRIFCVYGTALGLVIGGIAAFLFKPNGWSWGNTAITSIVIFLLVYGMIWLAMSKPAKIAGSISPIEAAKNTGYESFPAVSKKLHRKITPFSLAIMGSSRNRKKWIVTVLSLGIAGIMFMGGTTLLSSLDMERLARHGLLEYGEFELSRNAIKNDPHGQTGVQLKNPLNEDLIQTIAQMEGVAEVSEYKTLEAKFEYNGVTKKENITPFTPDQQALLEKYLVTGTADYSTMSENHEILVLRNEYADYIYDWTFHVGDTVKFRWFDGIREQETEFRIAGEISDGIFEDDGGGKLFGKTGFFLLPEELMNQMMPSGFNFNSQLLVRMDDLSQEPALRKTMNDLLDTTPMVTMESFYDYYQDSEAMYQRTSLVIWGLCGFIMLFAVINLVNTLIATTLSRKHEFSVLRSVGMAKKQLRQTVQCEGILLAFWNICITVLIGTAVGYGIVRYLNYVGDDTWVWHFPAVHFAGYMIVAILLPVLIAAALIHLLEKKSIVQQLREID